MSTSVDFKNDPYGPRLEKAYTGAVFDILRALGRPRQTLPQTLHPLFTDKMIAGRVFTVRGKVDQTLDGHTTLVEWTRMLSKAPSGAIVIVQPNDSRVSHLGELSTETFLYKGIKGYIVDGGIRDSHFIHRLGFPVWYRYHTPVDVVGYWAPEAFGEPITIGEVTVRNGDWCLADRDGVVIIPQEMIEEVTLKVEECLRTENKVRTAILQGMDPVDAYLKYRKF
jgi:regulator of RNase E activity RraA